MNRMHYALLMVLAAFFSSACTLDASITTPTSTFQPTFPPPLPPSETPQPAVTIVVTEVAQVSVTQVIAVTQAAVVVAPATITCTAVPAGWQPYTVVAGDTLGALAILTFTSIADLTAANCITNPDLIYAGQVLYVPQTPGTFLPTAVIDGSMAGRPTVDNILIEPSIVMNGTYTVTPGQVTVRAGTIADATSVTFYMAPTGTASTPTVIGTDNNLADGASATLEIGTAPLQANVWAIASGATGLQTTSNPILVQANM